MAIGKNDTVLFLLILNVLVAVSASYFPQAGGIHAGVVRAALMLAIIPVLFLNGCRLTWTGLLILYCLGYLVVLTPFSSNPIGTFDTVVKVGLGLLMFILGYSYLRGRESHEKLAVVIPIMLVLFICNFFLAQVFNLGHSYYDEDGFRAGGGGVQQTYLIAYLILFVPLLGFYRGNPFQIRKMDAVLMLMSLFPLFLIGRRGAILGFVSGLLIYLFLTPRKGRIIAVCGVAVMVAVLTMPLYLDRISGVLAHRLQETENPEQVGRVRELVLGVEMMWNENIGHALFGSELFNYTALTGGRRPLHTDYATYLIGGGIIGFTLYFSIVGLIWVDLLRRLRSVTDVHIRREFTAVMSALIAAYLVISFTGQYYVVSSLAVVFLLWGSVLAYLEEYPLMMKVREEVQ